jgi:hypothetical protein
VDECEQLLFGDRRRKKMLKGFNPNFLAGFLLIANVNLRPWIVTDQDDGQTRHQSPASLEPIDFFLDLFLNFLGNGFTIND